MTSRSKKKSRFVFGLVTLLGSAAFTMAYAADEPLRYKETRRVDHVDEYHGTSVADPYRWLEDDVRENKEVAEWVEDENKITFGYLKSIPERQAIEDRITELWDYEKYSSPFKRGGRYYFYKNDGLQNQSVLYTMDSLDEEPKLLVDPNTWSEDGTVALSSVAFSDDGKYMAYSIADAGSDWRTWKVMELASRKTLDDELKWIKFSSVAWTRDSQGFYYGRYDEPKEGAAFQSLNLNQKLFYHKLGTPQSDDRLVHADPEHPKWGFGADVSEDGRWLVITTWKGTDDKYRIDYQDLSKPDAKTVNLIDNFDHEYSFIGNDGTLFYFKTDNAAPRRRVIAIDVANPDPAHWSELVPQAEETLTSVGLVADRFVTHSLKDARTQIKMYDVRGKFEREVEFPGIGSASGFGGRREHTETFYSFSGFATPPTIYRFDMLTGKSTLYRRSGVKFDPDRYETKQVFYKSPDGTRVPMFLTHKKGLMLGGNNPTLLYGYGGFNIPITPRFSISRVAWMEMGGVYAVANIRGGGEYGEEWHRAGTKLKKQNVFDDFIAAAEWLIAKKYTSTPKLAIQGGSNGGLLVGACMTQRPELFGACLPAVGVMDMLRFHKFTAGRFWVDDYGSADDAKEFRALHAYSPYHNLKEGAHYPATLITTADTDDRVVPGHSFKFAARLQASHAGKAPVLIRIETRAGHGAGKPTSKVIEEIADQWAFLVKTLDMQLPQD